MASDLTAVNVLLYSGRSWMSRLIRWQTRSRYSHAAIRFDDQIVEAVEGKGVIERPIGDPEALAHEFFVSVTLDQEARIKRWVLSQVGKPYDWLAILRFLSRRRMSSNNRWFCSELVFEAFRRVGVTLLARTEPWEVSPGLLARSPLLIGPCTPKRDTEFVILAEGAGNE